MPRRRGEVLRYLNPVVLIGVALSVTLSVVLDVTNAATGVESLLAGLMGTMITLLLDATARAESRFQVRQALEAAEWLPATVQSLGEGVREVTVRYPRSEVTEEVRQRFQVLRAELDDLRQGRIIRPGEDYDTLMRATERCSRRIEAVTNALAHANGAVRWWRADHGRRYWEANLAALARGVSITRIFVCDQVADELSEIIDEQRAAGVDARIVAHDRIDPAMHLNLAVWDRRCAWVSDMNARGDIVGTVFSVRDRDLERLTTVFDACQRAAR